jgi:hypothetical protein
MDNKKFSMNVRQLESLHSKDTDYNSELEKRLAQEETKNQRLEQVGKSRLSWADYYLSIYIN